jgi:hypothetical protein
VAIYALGPGAHLFQGVQEQNVIFHVMMEALRLPLLNRKKRGQWNLGFSLEEIKGLLATGGADECRKACNLDRKSKIPDERNSND